MVPRRRHARLRIGRTRPSGANPYGGMWIGTAGKASANIEEYPELYGQYMFIVNGKRTFKVSKDARSQGMSMRCVKE